MLISRRLLLAGSLATIASPGIAQNRRRRRIEGEMRVGAMYLGIAGDAGWSHRHDHGLRAALASLGGRASLTAVERVASDLDGERVAMRLARDGHHIVIATSIAHEPGVIEAAKRFPNVMFEQVASTVTAENISTFDARGYEARFVQGAIAGRQSRRAAVGFVGSMKVAEVYQGINAFVSGVRSVRPDARVLLTWTGAWFDPWGEAEAARKLIRAGCEIIAHHTDSPAPLQVAEQRGARGFGQADDMRRFAPNAQLTATVFDWSTYYAQRLGAALDGSWMPDAQWSGIVQGTVKLAPYGVMIPQARAAGEAAEAAVRADALLAFKGPIRDTEGKERVAAGARLDDQALRSMDWLAAGIVEMG
jgi:basic membrane protein A and related proteins